MRDLAATICLVPEVTAGPFLFQGELADCCRRVASVGFTSVELFLPDAQTYPAATIRSTLADFGLRLLSIGTGAGFVVRRMFLSSRDAAVRRGAGAFAGSLTELAGDLGAKIILGSIMGSAEPGVSVGAARQWQREGVDLLAEKADALGVEILVEPLNRYESNLLNTLGDGAALLSELRRQNVRLLADLFHMNIEESSPAAALREHLALVGHIHFVDSNRGPAGSGHINFTPFAEVIREGAYTGTFAAEALPRPDPESAARRALDIFQKLFCPQTASCS